MAMQNAKMEVVKGELVIRVPLAKQVGPSKSGKTILIATSGGSVEVPGQEGTFVGLNVFKYPTAK